MSGNPNSLSREVLRWIQSLDLAYSIKNPKRDFSNGFLIAEIFSRYFVRGISMHSYDNGTAIRVKKDNWGQLLKFFRKQGLDMITQDEVTAIIHCEDGAVASFIKRIYQALTQREVQEVAKRPPLEKLPAYMRTTGSKVVKDKLRTGNFTEHPDQTTTQAALEAELGTHEATLQLEKSVDPERFSSLSLSGSRAPHQPKPMGEEEAPVPQVTVERIEVKQSDRNIAQLRASQDPMAARLNSSVASAGSSVGSPPQTQSFSAQVANMQRGVQDIFDDALSGSGFDDVGSFTSALVSGDEAAVSASEEVFYSVYNDAMKVAEAVVQTPNDFWIVSNLFSPLTTGLSSSSNAFKVAVDSYASIGHCILKVEPPAASALFANYALKGVCETIAEDQSKRYSLLSLYYSYAVPSGPSHVEAIKKLTEVTGTQSDLVSALSSLISIEDPATFDGEVMDLYLYYGIIGLGQSSPSVRASAVAMLGEAFLRGGISEVGKFVEPLQNMASDDTYWESKAQLLVVSSVVLGSEEGVTDEIREAFVGIIEKVFHKGVSGKVKKVGVAYLAPVIGVDMERLLPLFLDVLLGMKQVDRVNLLGLGGGVSGSGKSLASSTNLAIGGTSGLKYTIQGMPGLDVAKGLLDFVNGNEVFYEEHACVLLGCAVSAEGDMGGNMWLEVWDGFRGVLTDSLLVEGVAETAGDIFFTMFAGNDQVAKQVVGGEPLQGILEEVFKEDSGEVCKENLVQLLTRVANFSPSGLKYVRSLLEKSEVVKGSDDLLNLMADLKR